MMPKGAHDHENIVLVGFMGSGKTYCGRLIAKQMGWRHVDCDRRIELREKRNIAEIFAKKGEDYFRKAESKSSVMFISPIVLISLG